LGDCSGFAAAFRADINHLGGRCDLRAIFPIELQEIDPCFVVKDPVSVQFQRFAFQLGFGTFGVVMLRQVFQKLLV